MDGAGIGTRFGSLCHLSGCLIFFKASLEVDWNMTTDRGGSPSESDGNGPRLLSCHPAQRPSDTFFFSDKMWKGNRELRAPFLSEWFRAESGTAPSWSCESLKPKSCWGGNHTECRIKMKRRLPQACSYVTSPRASYFLGEKNAEVKYVADNTRA